jgi:hypothetical protein
LDGVGDGGWLLWASIVPAGDALELDFDYGRVGACFIIAQVFSGDFRLRIILVDETV